MGQQCPSKEICSRNIPTLGGQGASGANCRGPTVFTFFTKTLFFHVFVFLQRTARAQRSLSLTLGAGPRPRQQPCCAASPHWPPSGGGPVLIIFHTFFNPNGVCISSTEDLLVMSAHVLGGVITAFASPLPKIPSKRSCWCAPPNFASVFFSPLLLFPPFCLPSRHISFILTIFTFAPFFSPLVCFLGEGHPFTFYCAPHPWERLTAPPLPESVCLGKAHLSTFPKFHSTFCCTPHPWERLTTPPLPESVCLGKAHFSTFHKLG